MVFVPPYEEEAAIRIDTAAKMLAFIFDEVINDVIVPLFNCIQFDGNISCRTVIEKKSVVSL